MASRTGSASAEISSANGASARRCVFIYDRRSSDKPEVPLDVVGVKTFSDFRKKTREALSIKDSEKFVITTTNREEIKDDRTWGLVEFGDTLYVLQSVDQALVGQAQERVTYLPHYDTIVKGGMYEYYASEGQNPLPYAFAELIDNALAATADNPGPRNIEILLHLDDQPNRNVIMVVDNGKGMSSLQLNNWAIYRLSKFNRKDFKGNPWTNDAETSGGCAAHMAAHPPEISSFIHALLRYISNVDDGPSKNSVPLLGYAPRSLNSDISYFGVGGKQAIFFIGSSTRMISKAKNSQDVHELLISKEEFERREKNNESIYTGYIRNRKAGDSSHIPNEEESLRSLIKKEDPNSSFTCVVINGINTVHVPYLRNNIKEWTRQLAHIYHYYVHGPEGNVEKTEGDENGSSPFSNIDISVTISGRDRPTKTINLREIEDDMQSLYIRSGGDSFEFKAVVEGMGIVEGILRYHPFLYDRETYPSDANDPRAELEPEDDHGYSLPADHRPARGRRAIFECFWNGRLIPYTSIEEFDWCSAPKKPRQIPLECFNRISGVLWTNDKFQVSTNKLTFIDLEMKLRDKNTAYTRILGRQEKRTAIEKEFHHWLRECHEKCDKQVKFSHFGGSISRPELKKNLQNPWGVFTQIEWDGKIFKKGQLVRIIRTLPLQYGSIRRFMLHGDYDGDVFATGGDIEIQQEPQSLYDEVKVFPLSKLDRAATQNLIKKYMEEEEAKLPDKLILTWPNGDDVTDGEKRAAGKTIGDLKVEIANRKRELINKLPGANSRKLLVELKVIWHSPNGDETIVSHISQHGKNWPYWFRKMENVRNLGPHTLTLQAVLNETGANTYSGKTLPCTTIRFTVTEAEPEKFTVGLLDGPFRIGLPFQIPLEFQDEFGHATKPTQKLKPVLEASGIEMNYDTTQVKGNSLIIKGITALGLVGSNAGKSFNLVVRVPGLEEDAQTLKIRLLPGPPHSIHVSPEEETNIENGEPVKFNVEVRDQAGNITSCAKLQVVCKFTGVAGLPTYSGDFSSSGQGVLTGEPLNIKKMKGEPQSLTAKFDIPTHKSISTVERTVTVTPSSRAARLDVSYIGEGGGPVPITHGQELFGTAGEAIKGLTFKLYDEGGREKEVDENLSKKMKVNWTAKPSKDGLLRGQLPDIKVPTQVTQSTYCSFSIADASGLEIAFTVKAVAGAPSQLKCTCVGSPQLRMGETMSGDILVKVLDKHGNDIKKLDKSVLVDLIVTGEGLVMTDMLRGLDQNSGFSISGVKFESGALGGREICIEWRGLKGYVRIQMMAGPPAKLSIVKFDPTQPVNVLNEHQLQHPLLVQLCDEAGNPSSEANVRVQVARDTGIKLVPSPGALKTNAKGQADFGVLAIHGKRGVYEIQPKAFMGRTTISGPKLKISIQPDLTKPMSLQVDYEKSTSYKVGEKMPDFTVKVLAEDENELSTAKASWMSLKMWKTEGPVMKPPSKAQSHPPDSKRKNDKDGVFYFTNRRFPETSGVWFLMFCCNDGSAEIFSNQISINVEAGFPSKLVPLQVPGTPTVSNTKSSTSRLLIRHLKLELQDQFNNTAGFDVNGKMVVEIERSDEKEDAPQLAGGGRQIEVPLTQGQATLHNLTIQENCGGRDSAEYCLRCTVHSDSLPKSKAIPHYNIPFLFYNDVKKQSQMAALSRERDSLTAAIKTYKSLFETTQQLIGELKMSLSEAQTEEGKAKNELTHSGIPARQLNNVANVDSLIETKIREQDECRNKPRRMCSVQPAVQHPQVLGKIAHLAQVTEADIARVLSWHMSADMDCVVTLTTKKAKEIYQQSHGKQQVLPLDSIYRKNLPDWNKPLPHVRIRPNWKPQGNPVYARNLLHFPNDEPNCKIVFGMLLGDTIILDNLDHANSYRQEIVRYSHCPTILTREGDRIRSNGKFGGLMNKALPIEKLKGVVFGEPISKDYDNCCHQIDMLQRFKSAVQKRQCAADDLQEQVSAHKAPEMQSKLRECEEAEQQLKDIDMKLGMSPASGGRSNARNQQQMFSPPEEPAAKRGRNSIGAVNGNATNSATPPTPTRTSSRRSAGTPLSTTPSKRARRN